MAPDLSSVWQFVNSGAVLAVVAYVITNEKRMAKLEAIIELLTRGK